MKKVFAFLLVICMLAVTATSFAAGVNLKKMTDDEIVQLLKDVQNELVKRKIEKSAKMPAGKYIVGRDFPAGCYMLKINAKGDDWGNLTVKGDKGSGSLKEWEVVSADNPETFFFTLEKDDELACAVPFILTISAGVKFE